MLWVAGGNPRPPALSDNPAMLHKKWLELIELNQKQPIHA